jgi:hypothetical protein
MTAVSTFTCCYRLHTPSVGRSRCFRYSMGTGASFLFVDSSPCQTRLTPGPVSSRHARCHSGGDSKKARHGMRVAPHRLAFLLFFFSLRSGDVGFCRPPAHSRCPALGSGITGGLRRVRLHHDRPCSFAVLLGSEGRRRQRLHSAWLFACRLPGGIFSPLPASPLPNHAATFMTPRKIL